MTVQPIHSLPQLPPRPEDAHKGTFGRVLLVAGSVSMSGAAILAGNGALRGGAGLVHVAVPAAIAPVVGIAQPCYMVTALPMDGEGRISLAAEETILRLCRSASVVAIGPGLGQGGELSVLLRRLLTTIEQPVILDADALNALGPKPIVLKERKHPWMITPHQAEFARLLDCEVQRVASAREEAAVKFAQEFGGVVVLKGASSIVTDGRKGYINTTGNPGMATGGSGDVLTGVIAALVAQKMDLLSAAVLGVYLHGLAGDLARDQIGEVSLIATDLLTYLPKAFRDHFGDR
jgi:NAD(P)H-hydrate epimerase